MDDTRSNIGFVDSETLQEEFSEDVDGETLQKLMEVWLRKIHLKSAEFNAFSEIVVAKMEVRSFCQVNYLTEHIILVKKGNLSM